MVNHTSLTPALGIVWKGRIKQIIKFLIILKVDFEKWGLGGDEVRRNEGDNNKRGERGREEKQVKHGRKQGIQLDRWDHYLLAMWP